MWNFLTRLVPFNSAAFRSTTYAKELTKQLVYSFSGGELHCQTLLDLTLVLLPQIRNIEEVHISLSAAGVKFVQTLRRTLKRHTPYKYRYLGLDHPAQDPSI